MTDKAPARKVKTPEARAREQVAILQRREAKIRQQGNVLEHQMRDLTQQLNVTQKRLTYALANPDLPAPANLKQPDPKGPPSDH